MISTKPWQDFRFFLLTRSRIISVRELQWTAPGGTYTRVIMRVEFPIPSEASALASAHRRHCVCEPFGHGSDLTEFAPTQSEVCPDSRYNA